METRKREVLESCDVVDGPGMERVRYLVRVPVDMLSESAVITAIMCGNRPWNGYYFVSLHGLRDAVVFCRYLSAEWKNPSCNIKYCQNAVCVAMRLASDLGLSCKEFSDVRNKKD